MRRQMMIVGWIAVMLMAPALLGWSVPTAEQKEILYQFGGADISQASDYSGVIPMDLSVMVGDSGDDLTDVFNYLAAVPFVVRSNSTHTASGLILPDDIEDYASPLDDWLEVLGGSMNELVFIGDVQNTDHQALTSVADSHVTISGIDHIEMAANLAEQFFVGAPSVVLVEAPNVDQFSQSITITDTTATLTPMSSRSHSGRTTGASGEYFGSFDPTGGGAIITRTSGDSYIYFDLLASVSGNYYPMDFPYYDGRTVMYPYDERTSWVLHVIDLYPYERNVDINFDIDVPDADFYPFEIASGEDCRIDFDLSVVGGTPCDIGLNVLDPSGNIILTGNRYTLFEDVDEVSEISVSLSHPEPGQYRAYVYSAEHTTVSYDLSIVKQVISSDYIAAGTSAANGAGLASLLGAPLLYTSIGSLDTVTSQALETLSPKTVYLVNATGAVDSEIEVILDAMGFSVNSFDNFTEIQWMLAELGGRDSSDGSVVLYDSIGSNFAAAGLSAAQRKCPAVPFSYNDSRLMTLSQIPEQISWNREYQFPLSSSFSIIDYWMPDADFTRINPPVSSMTPIAYRFFSWLSTVVDIRTVEDVITIAPYYGPGESLPPSFERALTGRADTGRYSSVDTDATLVQIIRSILRIPLMSVLSRSEEVLGSYLVYSYGDQVMDNDREYSNIDNSNDFSTLITDSGLTPVMQVGPSTISELNDAPYAWVATVHGGVGYELYEDDGRIALFYTDTWRGYDSGRSASSPDADTTESPQYVVNPPEGYMDVYNMSQLVTGANLRGMFALLDSCQLGSSYGPSTLLESGADAVVACRADALVGPADMLEFNILDSMVNLHYTIGEALDYSFDINSHRYAASDIGIDSYVSTSEAAIVGASSLQFTIFGDPDITLYDWDATPFPVMDRCVGVGPTRVALAHPGSTYQLPLGMHDPIGNVYASEGSYNIRVYDTEDNLLTLGVGVCTQLELGVFDIQFNEASTLGVYDIEITDTNTNETFYNQIILEWPDLVIQSIESSSYTELGTWQLQITVYNPQDVVAETTVQVSLNNDILLIADASWTPGISTNDFELVLMFGHSGAQTMSVIITIGSQSTECGNYDTPLQVSGHWITPVLWYAIPSLGVAVIVSGVYTRRLGSRVITLQEAMEAEIAGDHESAFDLYGKNGLTKAATRVAVKEDLPEHMMEALMHYYGNEVNIDLQNIAVASVADGDFRMASKIYLLLKQNDKGLLYRAIVELEEGSFDDAVETFRELVSQRMSGSGVEVIRHLQSMDAPARSGFVSLAKEDILKFASNLLGQESNQVLLLSVVEGHVEDEYLVKFLMNIKQVNDAAKKILSLKTVPKMVKLTQVLSDKDQQTLAPIVVRLMLPTYKLKQIAKFITSLDIIDKAKEEAVAPLLEQLVLEPRNKERIKALQAVSKSTSTGSLRMIDDAIEAVNSMISAAEELGVSSDTIGTTGLVPVIAGLKDRKLGEKLLAQTERQILRGSVPASANIDALAEYVYSLRSSVYGVVDAHPQVGLKLRSYQETLQNRLSHAIQEAITSSKLYTDDTNWLEVSSDAIAEKILVNVPLTDAVSVIKGCYRALEHVSTRLVLTYLENSIDMKSQTAAADAIMNNPLQRDRILRKHMKLKIDEFGRSAWVPDQEAAYAEVLSEVLGKWKPYAISAISRGLFKAARNVARSAVDSQIHPTEVRVVSIEFLSGARSISDLGEEEVVGYVRNLQKYLKREVVDAIVQKARWPKSLLDESPS
ncbi:MAG: hypothetical protein ACXAB0_09625 [Candidatus Thorarchaeota archaeon]|jgi:hypothetical protein